MVSVREQVMSGTFCNKCFSSLFYNCASCVPSHITEIVWVKQRTVLKLTGKNTQTILTWISVKSFN